MQAGVGQMVWEESALKGRDGWVVREGWVEEDVLLLIQEQEDREWFTDMRRDKATCIGAMAQVAPEISTREKCVLLCVSLVMLLGVEGVKGSKGRER